MSTGSDIIQNSFNFLADGYHQLPGYNTAGNRYRFVNFDSSGDAQGRSAFTDPRLLPTITGNGTIGENGEKYIKQSDLRLLNPTISLARRPGPRRPPERRRRRRPRRDHQRQGRPDDGQRWLDRRRSQPGPAELDATRTTPRPTSGTKLLRVQVATDRQLIAHRRPRPTRPTTITAGGDPQDLQAASGRPGARSPATPGPAPAETIIPLLLPTDAGMWNTFVANVAKQNPGAGVVSSTLRANPNSIQVQQNDPTAITACLPAQRANAIVPFPRGRFRTLETGYYTQTKEFDGTLAAPKTNLYNTDAGHRTPASAAGLQLLDADQQHRRGVAHGAVRRQLRLQRDRPRERLHQHDAVAARQHAELGRRRCSTTRTVRTPFVRTPAGEALLDGGRCHAGLPRVRHRQHRDPSTESGTRPPGDDDMTTDITTATEPARRARTLVALVAGVVIAGWRRPLAGQRAGRARCRTTTRSRPGC